MGKQHTEDIVREILLLRINPESLLGKAVPAVSEPRRGQKGSPGLTPFNLTHRAFKTAVSGAFDRRFILTVAQQFQNRTHRKLKYRHQCDRQEKYPHQPRRIPSRTPTPHGQNQRHAGHIAQNRARVDQAQDSCHQEDQQKSQPARHFAG